MHWVGGKVKLLSEEGVVLKSLRQGVKKSKFSYKFFGKENKVSQIIQILTTKVLKM